jgi:hypothetical protein
MTHPRWCTEPDPEAVHVVQVYPGSAIFLQYCKRRLPAAIVFLHSNTPPIQAKSLTSSRTLVEEEQIGDGPLVSLLGFHSQEMMNEAG